MTSDNPPQLPPELLSYQRTHVDDQRVPLALSAWEPLLAPYPDLLTAMASELDANRGIRRSFVHDLAGGNPIELFLATMAWGFGLVHYGPSRVTKMMQDHDFSSKVANIVADTQRCGAADGWTSLLRDNKITQLGMAYGTKLLYFAGYTSNRSGPRPLVLDQFVRAALVRFGAPVPAKGTVWRSDYERYLAVAERWAADPRWDVEADVVEFALFDLGKATNGTYPQVDDDDAELAEGDPSRDG